MEITYLHERMETMDTIETLLLSIEMVIAHVWTPKSTREKNWETVFLPHVNPHVFSSDSQAWLAGSQIVHDVCKSTTQA